MANTLSWGQYKIAVPDFSNVGRDAKQLGIQMYQVEQQEKERERQRRDMMWKNFIQTSNIQPADVTRSKLKKKQQKYLQEARNSFKNIADEKDGELDWEDYQKAQEVRQNAQLKIERLQKQEEMWREELEMLYDSDPDEWKPERAKEIMNWQGDVDFNKIKLRPEDRKPKHSEVATRDYAKKFIGGNEFTNSVTSKANGKIYTDSKDFIRDFFNLKNNGEVEDNIENQMRVVDNMINKQGLIDWNYRFENELSDDAKTEYEIKAKEKGYTPIEWFARDKLKPHAFKVERKRTVKPDSDKAKGGKQGDAINFDMAQDADVPDLIPKDFGDKENTASYSISDKSITLKGNELKGIYEHRGGDRWERKKSESYDIARLTGFVLDEEDNEYAQIWVKPKGKNVKKNDQGETIYNDYINQVEGTKEEIRQTLKEKGLSEKKVNEAVAGANPVEEDQEPTRVYVPVEENQYLKKYRNYSGKKANELGWDK